MGTFVTGVEVAAGGGFAASLAGGSGYIRGIILRMIENTIIGRLTDWELVLLEWAMRGYTEKLVAQLTGRSYASIRKAYSRIHEKTKCASLPRLCAVYATMRMHAGCISVGHLMPTRPVMPPLQIDPSSRSPLGGPSRRVRPPTPAEEPVQHRRESQPSQPLASP